VPLAEDVIADHGMKLMNLYGQPDSVIPLTGFEIQVLLAADLFKNERCDFAVFEVGLGGREDGVNALNSWFSIAMLTTMGLDHQAQLGNTLESIISHKTGVCKENCPVVVGRQERDGAEKLLFSAIEYQKSSPCLMYGRDFDSDTITLPTNWNTLPFSAHAATAIQAAHFILESHTQSSSSSQSQHENMKAFCKDIACEAVRRTRWPCRGWHERSVTLPGVCPHSGKHKKVTMIFDAAHNSDGLKVLSSNIRHRIEQNRDSSQLVHAVVFGAMGDKLTQGGDITEAFAELRKSVGDVQFYGALVDKKINDRAADRETLENFFKSVGIQDAVYGCVEQLFTSFHDVLDANDSNQSEEFRVLVCGSLFLLREVFQVCNVPAPLAIYDADA
jgi:folylpolyglutamate synthase/dihydrofolate synthase